MADRYWVGGNATWDATAGSKWSATSGGAGGASVPTSADIVFFNASSGAVTVTLGISPTVFALRMNGFLGTFAYNGQTVSIAGNNTNVFSEFSSYSITGTPILNFTYSGSTGSRSITTVGRNPGTSINMNITGGTDTITGVFSCNNMNFTGFTGLWFNSSFVFLEGSLTLGSGMTLNAGAPGFSFGSLSGNQTLTSNGVTIGGNVSISLASGTFQLADALVMSSTRTLTLTEGTFNANNQNVTVGLFVSNGLNTRTLTMGSGTWTITGGGAVWNINSTNLTLNANTSTIVLNSATANSRTFTGGASLVYNNLTIGNTSQNVFTTFNSSNTFNTISNTTAVTHTILFSVGTTTTVTNWNINGVSGRPVTLNASPISTPGIVWNLVKAGGGTVTSSYVNIGRSVASPANTWNADSTSINLGNNTGWNFANGGGGAFFFL